MSSVSNDLPAGSKPPAPPELSLPTDVLVASTAERLVDQAKASGVALTGDGGLLTDLVRQLLQGALDAELTDHLGYLRRGSQLRSVRGEVGTGLRRPHQDRAGHLGRPRTEPVSSPSSSAGSCTSRTRWNRWTPGSAKQRPGGVTSRPARLLRRCFTWCRAAGTRAVRTWTRRINGWNQILNTLTIHCHERLTAATH